MLFNGQITLERLRDQAFLKRLAPTLHVQDETFLKTIERLGLSDQDLDAFEAGMKKEGYIEVACALQKCDVTAMADVVKNLAHQGIPPVFAFLYDEFWGIYTALDPIVKRIFAGEYYRLPDFWAWHVDPKKSEAGWEPHRDKGADSLFPDGRPKSLTIWIPLTDATTLNGCMYVVPADRDPAYRRPGNVGPGFKLQDVRALPAKAGTVMIWDQNVMHWGSHASERAPEARVSIALEFQSAAIPAMNNPLTKIDEIMPFKLRQKLIGKQMLQYKHMYGLAPELERWAKAA